MDGNPSRPGRPRRSVHDRGGHRHRRDHDPARPAGGSGERALTGSELVFTLVGKPDCHLCQEMQAVVAPVLAELGARLVERDVREDKALAGRYLLEIPVLLLGEREVARHRISAEELRARLGELL